MKFKEADLELVSRADPADIPFIVEGATVWLRSGSPPMHVLELRGTNAVVTWEDTYTDTIPVACLTPEPSPNKDK